jgi:hypothetical protein
MGRHANFIVQQPGPVALAARARLLSASIALALLLSVSSAPAATEIQGAPDDLQLKLENATIIEILNALSARFKVTFKARSHNPRVLTGIYSGTLRETLTRILNGNDYILEISDRGLEILILGASEPQNPPQRQVATAPAAAPTVSPTAPPPVRTTQPATSMASSRPAGVPNATPSAPPLSSFAVVPPVTP